MGIKTIASIAQLITGIGVLCVAYLQYSRQQPNANPIFWSVFFLFTSALLIDKIGLIFSNLSLERDEKDLRLRLDRQPSLFAGRNDLVSFMNDAEGVKYCVAISALAIGIKNTVLRYESFGPASLEDESEGYDEWLQFKFDSATKHSCTWTEIVSTHIGHRAVRQEFLKALETPSHSRFYSYKYLDETAHPMIQMTIFQLSNGTKEIVFGWEFPGIPHGPCFLTRNEEIIAYFENYFDHFWGLAKAPNANTHSITTPAANP